MRVKHTCGARQARGSREATETSLSLGSRHAAGSTVARCPCVACKTALIMSVSQLHWQLVLQGIHEAHHSRHMRVKHTCGARQARGSREATETSLSLGSRHAAGSTVARCPCVACKTALIMSVSQLHWQLVLQGTS